MHNQTVVNRVPTTSMSSPPTPRPVPTFAPTFAPTQRVELPTARPTSYKDIDLTSYNVKSTTKKTSKFYEYEKHPNEVVKNEELTYNSADRISGSGSTLLLLSVCAMAAAQRWHMR